MFSMSKTYGMAGWRLGFVVGNTEIVSRLDLFADHARVGIFVPVQHAGIAALTGRRTRSPSASRRTPPARPHAGAAAPSQGRGLVLPVVGAAGGTDAGEAARRHRVAVAPGEGFGSRGAGWARLSLAVTDEVLDTGLERLDEHWTRLDHDQDIERMVEAARDLPSPAEMYLEEDFVLNLLEETVLDYQLQTVVVVAALQHFRDNRWDDVRTLDDLEELLTQYPRIVLATNAGNSPLEIPPVDAGSAGLPRPGPLLPEHRCRRRGIAQGMGDHERVQARLRGRVKGLGPAVYQWLVMGQGVDTVKPDVHVRRFAEAALGRALSDQDVIDVVTAGSEAVRYSRAGARLARLGGIARSGLS